MNWLFQYLKLIISINRNEGEKIENVNDFTNLGVTEERFSGT